MADTKQTAATITGTVTCASGNHMPAIGACANRGTSGVLSKAKVYIMKGQIREGQAGQEDVVKIVQTDNQGKYTAEVEPGEYTVMIKAQGGFYLNALDNAGHHATVKAE